MSYTKSMENIGMRIDIKINDRIPYYEKYKSEDYLIIFGTFKSTMLPITDIGALVSHSVNLQF